MPGKQPNFFKYAHEMKYRISAEDGQPLNRVGSGWENFFTEAVAFFLQVDRQALERLCRELLREMHEIPERVETQAVAEDGTPDIAICFASGRRWFIESKIDAPLGHGQPGKYLGTSQDENPPLVALFSRRDHKVPPEVRDHGRYLKPRDGDHHYSWRNLYDWLRDDPTGLEATRFRRYFLEYMEWLGLGWTPPGPWSQLFEDRTVPANRKVREAFGERLTGVRMELRRLGYRVAKGDGKALVGTPPKREPFMHLVVTARRTRKEYVEEPLERYLGSASLSVSLVYDKPTIPEHCQAVYRAFGPEPYGAYQWVRLSPYRMNNPRIRLEFVANLEPFLCDDPHEMSDRLSAGCSEILRRVTALAASPDKG
jgi:hypothetical protein